MPNTSINYDILSLLLSVRDVLELPEAIQMDYLPPKGDAIAYQPNGGADVIKTYLDGSKVCVLDFSILAVTTDHMKSSEPSLRVTSWLEAIGTLFAEMNNYRLSENRVIIRGTRQKPVIIRRTDDGRVVYSIELKIEYEE